MNTFLVTLAAFAIAVVLMASGVILSNRRIAGSCGGVGCDLCKDGEKPPDCPSRHEANADAAVPSEEQLVAAP